MLSNHLRTAFAGLIALTVLLTALYSATVYAQANLGNGDCDASEPEWAQCFSTRIADVEIAADGRYSISWENWAADQSADIVRVNARRLIFVYRHWDDTPTDGTPWVQPGSCNPVPQRLPRWWSCDSATNVRVDSNGNPSTIHTIPVKDDLTGLISQFDATGRKRITGDVQLGPKVADTPSSPDDVWNGETKIGHGGQEFEFHIIVIQVLFDDDSSEWFRVVFEGANGF